MFFVGYGAASMKGLRRILFVGVFRRENTPRLYREKKKEQSYKKECELYASPSDVKSMLKMFAQHRKKSCDPFTGCGACDVIISFRAPFRG